MRIEINISNKPNVEMRLWTPLYNNYKNTGSYFYKRK